MKKFLLAAMSVVLFACGAADDPGALGPDDESAETVTETGQELTSCPSAGTCSKAASYCLNGTAPPGGTWCQILAKCEACWGYATAQPAEE